MKAWHYAAFGLIGFYLYTQRYSLKGYVVRVTKNWTKFDSLFEKYASLNGVPAIWLKAIALNESSLGNAPSVARGLVDPKDTQGSVSTDGKSWGLMQVTLSTAKMLDSSATPEKLNDAEYSISLASKYLKQLMATFSKSEARYDEWVIKSYNQGPGNTLKEKIGSANFPKEGYAAEYWARFQRNLNTIKGV